MTVRRLALAGLLALAGCTVPDDVVDNKPCYPLATDHSCEPGYECKCVDTECRCRESDRLQSTEGALAAPLPAVRVPRCEDPSLRLLRGLGLEVERGPATGN